MGRLDKFLAEKEKLRQEKSAAARLLTDAETVYNLLNHEIFMRTTTDDRVAAQQQDVLQKTEKALGPLKEEPLAGCCYTLRGNVFELMDQMADAMVAYTQADAQFEAAHKKGVNLGYMHTDWAKAVTRLGFVSMCLGQLTDAERYLRKGLAQARQFCSKTPLGKMLPLEGLVRLYWRQKKWSKLEALCTEMLTLCKDIPIVNKRPETDAFCLVMLANAKEGKGDFAEARKLDQKAYEAYRSHPLADQTQAFNEGICCTGRRAGLECLMAGQPYEALDALEPAVEHYITIVDWLGIRLQGKDNSIIPAMDACRVYAEALKLTGQEERARLVLADITETQEVLDGYQQGLLDETRRELQERRAAMAAARAAAASGEEADKKKSKAAKRKQAKRKAQQKKKAEMCAKEMEAQALKKKEKGDKKADENQEKGAEQQMVAETVALTLEEDEKKQNEEEEEEEEEEEQEEECSVCLCPLEDGSEEQGPELVCGHNYHMECLAFWVERCRGRGIEATCPYCRAPVQELQEAETMY